MRAALPSLLLIACGGSATPGVAAGPPASRPVAEPVSCGDVGVILRGRVDDVRRAGPDKEAVIANACVHGKWAADLLRCIGDQPRPKSCLAALTAEQKAAYDQRLTAWNERFPDEMLDDEAAERFDGDAPDDTVDCADAVHDVELFAPVIAATGDDRDTAMSLREHALLSLCDDGWSNEARACFRDAQAGAVAPCRALLEADQQKAIADRLAALDQLAAKIATVRRKPAAFDCRQVAAVHYGDAAWKGKLPALGGAARARAIIDSRNRLTRSCTDDKWPAPARACIVAGGGDMCFTAHRLVAWGFPAPGVMVKTGIAECDAYAATVTALARCDKFRHASRDALLQSFTQLNQGWLQVSPDARRSTAANCKQNDEAVRQLASSVGCRL